MYSYGTTMVVLRYAGRDDYGDPVGEATRTTVPGVAVGPSESHTDTGNRRTQTSTRVSVYDASRADVRAADEVELLGQRWHVDGEPADARSPLTGWRPGRVIQLVSVTG